MRTQEKFKTDSKYLDLFSWVCIIILMAYGLFNQVMIESLGLALAVVATLFLAFPRYIIDYLMDKDQSGEREVIASKPRISKIVSLTVLTVYVYFNAWTGGSFLAFWLAVALLILPPEKL